MVMIVYKKRKQALVSDERQGVRFPPSPLKIVWTVGEQPRRFFVTKVPSTGLVQTFLKQWGLSLINQFNN